MWCDVMWCDVRSYQRIMSVMSYVAMSCHVMWYQRNICDITSHRPIYYSYQLCYRDVSPALKGCLFIFIASLSYLSPTLLLRNGTVAASLLMTQSQNVQNTQARTYSSGNRNMSGTASNMNSIAALNSKKKVPCLCVVCCMGFNSIVCVLLTLLHREISTVQNRRERWNRVEEERIDRIFHIVTLLVICISCPLPVMSDLI